MEPKLGKSDVFLEIPSSFFEKMLYASNTGDLEYLSWAIAQNKVNLNKKYTFVWYNEGIDEALDEIEKEYESERKKYLEVEEKDMQGFLIATSRYNHTKKAIENHFKETCPYGSRADALLRHALEEEQMAIIGYLTKLDDVDYSLCYQTFYTAMRGHNIGIMEFLLDKGLNMNQRYNGKTVGANVLGVLDEVKDLDVGVKIRILDALEEFVG